MSGPHLARITIFPIKAFDGVGVTTARVLPATGALEHDRRHAVLDAEGRFVNGKREPKVHRIRARFDSGGRATWLRFPGDVAEAGYSLPSDSGRLAVRLTDYLGYPVKIATNDTGGFPDDTEASGPTVIGTETLRTVAGWFELTVEEVRRRFRANLEVGGVPAFWEDGLYGTRGEPRPFRIGGVTFAGVNPCQRCVVPSRDPDTGEPTAGFNPTFCRLREETLPHWADRSWFDHHFRLAVNTRLVEIGSGRIDTSDSVEQ